MICEITRHNTGFSGKMKYPDLPGTKSWPVLIEFRRKVRVHPLVGDLEYEALVKHD